MTTVRSILRTLLATASLAIIASVSYADSAYQVRIDTPGMQYVAGKIAFEVVNGDHASANNTLTIANFTTDGQLSIGAGLKTTGASGDLPGFVILADAEFYNKSQRDLSFNSTLSFYVTTSENFAEPGAPDRYSASLLMNTGLPFPTDDPSGSNALFTFDVDGSPGGRLNVYHLKFPSAVCTVTPVPIASVPQASYTFKMPSRPDLAFTLSQGNPPTLKYDQTIGSGPTATHQINTMPISTMLDAGTILKVESVGGPMLVTTTQGLYITQDGFQYSKVG